MKRVESALFPTAFHAGKVLVPVQGPFSLETKSPSHEAGTDARVGRVIPFCPRGTGTPIAAGLPKVYTLRVYLTRGPYGEEAVGQEIYRTLQIRGDQSLEDLHYAIFCSFDRLEEQRYEYSFGKNPSVRSGPRYAGWPPLEDLGRLGRQKVRSARLCSIDSLGLGESQVFGYWFGTVGEWVHLVQVLAIEPAKPHEEYPLLLEKVGAAPVIDPSRKTEGTGAEEGQSLAQEVLCLLVGEFQSRWRREAENVPVGPSTRLASALARLPAPWLEGIRQRLRARKLATRRESVQELARRLSNDALLRQIWQTLPVLSREMLAWILTEQGGWVTVQKLSRRYGVDRDISWWWNDGQEPVTPLGLLRLHGLVYVGKAEIRGRRCRIAAVPADLRTRLRRIVAEGEQENETGGRGPSGAAGPMQDSQRKTNRGGSAGRGAGRVVPPDPWQGIDTLPLGSFLSVCPLRPDTEGLYARMLGRIRRNPKAFPKIHLQQFLDRMIRCGSPWTRLAAYKLGFSLYGRRFAEPARRDEAGIVRKWVRDLLDDRQEDLF